MELKEALLRRRSIRKYQDKVVEDNLIEELLHAAMSGPSACNKRPWDFVVVKNKEKIEELSNTTQFTHIKAPLAIVVCGNLKRALPLKMAAFWIQDCSAATENILLRAVDLGLGSLWCGIHPHKNAEEKVREILGLDKKQVPLNIIYLGYPMEDKEPRDQYDTKRIIYID